MKKKMKAVKKNSQVVTEFEYKSDGLNLSGSISQTHEGEFVGMSARICEADDPQEGREVGHINIAAGSGGISIHNGGIEAVLQVASLTKDALEKIKAGTFFN